MNRFGSQLVTRDIMRLLYMVLITVFMSSMVRAQKIIDRKNLEDSPIDYLGYYIQDSRLDQFVGTWKWEDNERSLVIVLNKVQKFDLKTKVPLDLILDIIRGTYLYSDSMNEGSASDSVFMEMASTEGANTLGFTLRDALSGHTYRAEMILSGNDPNLASFNFNQMEKMTLVSPDGPITPLVSGGVDVPGGIESLEGLIFRRVDD